LFLAAEAGHAHVAAALLASGAQVATCNNTGENPLYIAALRGHVAVLNVLLAHCRHTRVDWQRAGVYGDGWTPLMAAVVANRVDIVRMLLAAAVLEEEERGGHREESRSTPLVLAKNRFGQTALHIGARRGLVRTPLASQTLPATLLCPFGVRAKLGSPAHSRRRDKAMKKLRIATVGISGGRSRDARRNLTPVLRGTRRASIKDMFCRPCPSRNVTSQ
jgi:hypothetical protein